jgi:ElaA protein
MITFIWQTFSKLTVDQLYAILKLRSEVFVVEQACPYLDLDDNDRFALHLLGMEQDKLVAYIRLFPPTENKPHVVFGRVVTAASARKSGYGKELMKEMLAYSNKHFPGVPIKCSAQIYLLKFYESFGLKTYGEAYEEDGIPHIGMQIT